MKYDIGSTIYEIVSVGYAKFELREHKITDMLYDTFGIMYYIQDCGLVAETIIDTYHNTDNIDDYNSIFASSKKKALELLINRETQHKAIASQMIIIADRAIQWANKELKEI